MVNLVSRDGLSSLPSYWATYALTRAVIEAGVPGDLVECGAHRGNHCAVMAMTARELGSKKRVHLFDSFEGLPPGTAEDGPEWAEGGIARCDLKSAHRLMKQCGVDDDRLVWHVGWFEKTVPAAKIPQIALLRLDGDLYESTAVCMEHFYDKIPHGGWCIVDDWNLPGCRKAVMEYVSEAGMAPLYWQPRLK